MIDWALAERLLDDGASYTEVSKTLKVKRETVARRFPGRGWTHKQGGEYGYAIRRANNIMSGKSAKIPTNPNSPMGKEGTKP